MTRRGRRAIVRKNDGHPEHYLWLDVDGEAFFLGVLVPGLTRGDVRAMAERFLDRLSARAP